MSTRPSRAALRPLLGAAIGAAVAAYGAYAAIAWYRYGRPSRGTADSRDGLLDRFMPDYDVADRHHVRVEAAAATTLEAATALPLFDALPVRAIIRAREILLHAPPAGPLSKGLLEQTLAIGWRVLAVSHDREIVVGAVTRPWEPAPAFRGVAPEAFVAFREPGYVKIAWTLRADPITDTQSMFRMETRAVATDAAARARFRAYWALLSPGIILIRLIALPLLKRNAERRAHPTAA